MSFTEGSEAVLANTCGRQLTLSSAIGDKSVFVHAMKAVISDGSNTFTMP